MGEFKEIKEKVISQLEALADDLVEMSRFIYNNPEIGFAEYKACSLLCSFLEKEGFTIEKEVAGLSTAFKAYVKGPHAKPLIGFVAEYDASPEIGHGCGHNLIGPAHVGAAVALKRVMHPLPGKIAIFGCPDGEERGGGLKVMLQMGEFKGVDSIIRFHPMPRTVVDSRPLSNRALGMIFRKNLDLLGFKEDDWRADIQIPTIHFDRLTLVVPAIAPYISICSEPTVRDDTPEFARAASTDLAHERMVTAAKAVAMTAVDLFMRPEELEKVKREFENSKLLRYRKIIGDR